MKIQQRERELYDPAECNYTPPDKIGRAASGLLVSLGCGPSRILSIGVL
jgi:hypothetical protein